MCKEMTRALVYLVIVIATSLFVATLSSRAMAGGVEGAPVEECFYTCREQIREIAIFETCRLTIDPTLIGSALVNAIDLCVADWKFSHDVRPK